MAQDKMQIIKELMYKPDKIRNISTAAHIDHGKTTFSDNLLLGAGMISEETAGKQLFMDTDKQEQERGITIWSANASMIHNLDGEDYLINLIDTPGHVDFGGDVTRAMRAVDGAIVLACAVEGVMPQTETVIRQALRERVKPILFINKVDRLIKELKLTPEEMQQRFMKIIKDVNTLIMKYGEDQFHDKWLVRVEDGSVAFGSAFRKWAISFPFMKKHNISFKDIIEKCEADKDDELAKMSPLHRVILNIVVKHLPNPLEAQKIRIPKIWTGDIDSEVGKSMMEMNEKGPLAGIVTKLVPDPHAGMVACCRLFSGTAKAGQEVHLVGQHKNKRLQQVTVYKGSQRIQMDEIPAGNIIGLVGIEEAFSGETFCDPGVEIQPFEAIKHIFQPVVIKSIEPKDPGDLTRLITFLKQVNREDPTLEVDINEETGEYLVHGLGELHINAKIERRLIEKGIDVITSPPIVVYRETVQSTSPEVEGKSSNKHNRFYYTVEPLDNNIFKALADSKIIFHDVKKDLKSIVEQVVALGMNRDEAKKIRDIYKNNVFIDSTKGVQYMHEVIEMLIEAFRDVCNSGPLAKEGCSGMLVRIMDVKLHEDSIHRGPAQVLPAVRFAIKHAMLKASATLLEPVQTIRIDVPEELMSNAMSQVQNRRGQIMDTQIERGLAMLTCKLPVAEMFGFEAALKSATGGKGFYSLIDVEFRRLPKELEQQAVAKIRQRKGLPATVGVEEEEVE
ncbi:MAG: elongation factor EF-2 [Candidatus Aenigmatarchaeota archaeon]